MNGHGGDDGMEPTTDAVEAVQPDQDALLIAELKQLVRDYREFIAGYHRLFHLPAGWSDIAAKLDERARETLGDAQLGGKEQ